MDMKVRSEQIRSYVTAQSRVAKQSLPEENRRVIFRLPTDSVEISAQSRALAKGRLRVQMDYEGTFAKVTTDNSNPMMQLIEDGMRDAKKHVDKMKELTELMEDPEISIEDRYATQMKLVELEGELEKDLHELYWKYQKMVQDLNLPGKVADIWDASAGQTDSKGMLLVFGRDSRYSYTSDRVTGEVFAFKKYSDMIDKRTALKKEMIQRVYMRELDPEAFEEYAEKLREAYRDEFKELADENGYIWNWNNGAAELKEITADLTGTTFPTNKDAGFVSDEVAYTGVDVQDIALSPPSADIVEAFYVRPEVDMFEYNMEKYVEEKLAKLEEDDYAEFNAMRVSVMSAKMAEESSDFLESLTNQLTEQFQRFAAANELIGDEEDPSRASVDQRERKVQIADIAARTINFLQKTLLGGIQKDATREADDGYNVKVKKTESPMAGVRDIFEPVPMTPAEMWQMLRPDLFFGKDNEAK